MQYNLANPTPFFDTVVDLTCWYPLNQEHIEEAGEGWDTEPETYLGNGPFQLAEYSSKDRIILEPAETHRMTDEIFWDRIEFYMIESQVTELQAFRTGELDITNKVSLPEVPYWKEQPEWNPGPTFGTYYVSFNNAEAPFDDARVRKAFNLCIDRELITDRLLQRGEIPSEGLIPHSLQSPRGGAYRDYAGDMIPDQDIERARQLLAEAGYGEDNQFPAVEYIYDTSEDHKVIAEQLQAMWRDALGVDVELRNVEWGVRLERGRQGRFDLIRNGWYGDYLDAMTFLELFVTGNNLNDPKFSSDRYDELIQAARSEEDAAEREDLLVEAERLLIEEEAAIAPLFTYAYPVLIQTGIEGVIRNATGDIHYLWARRTGAE